jgi:hypothetical protein
MKIKVIQSKLILLFGCLLLSCTDLLNEKNPSGLTSESVYTTPAGFESLVNAAYGTTRQWYGKEDGYTLTEGGTDLWLQGVDNRRVDLMTYNNLQATELIPPLSTSEIFLERIWERFYAAINLCNTGIIHIAESGMTPELQKIREAELRFLRAFYYWHIVETWGDVHFTLKETTTVELTANKTPVETFYNQIFEDLNFAVNNLPSTTADYGRATKPVAQAFLARMHLTRGNNTEASDLAKKVINDYTFALVPRYSDLWLMSNLKNREVIWAVNYTVDLTASDLFNATSNPLGHPRGGHNGHLMFAMAYERAAAGAIGMTRDIPNGRPFVRYMPSRYLLNLFDDKIDARYLGSFQTVWRCNAPRNNYVKTVNGVNYTVALATGDTAIFATKAEIPDNVDVTKKYLIIDNSKMYKADGSFNGNALFVALSKFNDPTRSTIAEVQSARDGFVIRLAEMYLIAAEAEFKLGNSTAAATFINTIRTRAALPGRTAAMQISPGAVTLDFILDERAREFAGEQLRWFDLKRTGKLVDRVTLYNPVAAPFIKQYHNLRPIPQKQIDAVTNKTEFTQNPGYQ